MKLIKFIVGVMARGASLVTAMKLVKINLLKSRHLTRLTLFKLNVGIHIQAACQISLLFIRGELD